MPTPLVTVILPYYNTEKTLKRAITSILNQTYTQFELLLIDNNSSDNSTQIVRQLAKEDNRIRLLDESKQGVVYAANHGIRNAIGKYIARMDADDTSHPQRLEKQIQHLESNIEISISATQVNYFNDQIEDTGFHHFVDWSNNQLSSEQIFNNRFVEFPVVNPSLMIRKSIFDHIGEYNEGDYPEDYEWFLRAIEEGFKVEKITSPLLDWHDSHSRLTRTDTRYQSDSFFKIKTQYMANFLHKIQTQRVWIWGAGKLGFKRSQWLLDYEIEIEGYIDIKKEKKLEKYNCIHFESISTDSQQFIISYISNRNKRDEVRDFLNKKGYTEGVNYLIAG